MWPYLPQNPCGCDSCESSNESTTDVGSDNVRYIGEPLACTGINPCDTLTVALQKIDNAVCEILDTLDVCCTTTTSTTTICPCTTYAYVGPRFNPGTITYVECNTLEIIGDTASSTPKFACVDNNYPIIEVGSINVIDTQECCSNTTTTTTTTLALKPYCYEVTVTGKCTVYWIDANGNPQSQQVTNDKINICADEGSIASACGGGAGISVDGGLVVCTSDAICQPPTTTTTTTTICPTNIVVNSSFDSNLDGWQQTIFPDWQWSPLHGGSAQYVGQDELAKLYQNVLVPGTTYDVSFDLWMNHPICADVYVKVFLGTTEYGPIQIVGNQTIIFSATCVGNSTFAIQGQDACGVPFNTIFIDNVYVSQQCE
jgi:hypothetical protein